jgi:hypothetical protein
MNLKEIPNFCLIGLLGIFLYCFGCFIAILLLPYNFDPFQIFLSELGNQSMNPNGAIFYSLGMVTAGLLSIIFYWGFYSYLIKDKTAIVFKIILVLGLLNSLSVSLTGVFAESINIEMNQLHIIFSVCIFATLLPLLFIVSLSLFIHPEYPNYITAWGFIAFIIDTIFLLTFIVGGEMFENAAILDFLAVFSYFFWIFLIILSIIRHRTKPISE